MVVEIALSNFTDPKQLGWAAFREGDCLVRVKIIRGRNGWPQVAIPSEYRSGTRIRILEYDNQALWEVKQQAILEAFQLAVPPEIFYPEAHGVDSSPSEGSSRRSIRRG